MKIERTYEQKKVDVWAKWNITFLSGLPVYLWIDAPSINQDKEKCPFLFKSLGCNASSPNSLDFASHDFRRPNPCALCCFLLGSRSDWVPPCCLLILWVWMLIFLWNNSWAFCSYWGFARWFGLWHRQEISPVFRDASSLYLYPSQIICFWPGFISSTEIIIFLAKTHLSDWIFVDLIWLS